LIAGGDLLDDGLRALLATEGTVRPIAAGSILFRPGELCGQFPIVMAGSLKVSCTTGAGRRILLYRVGPGQSCILSTACLLAEESFAAEGIAETAVTALMLSAGAFERLIASQPGFRRLVFAGYAARITALMARIEGLIDKPLEVRLAACLVERAGAGVSIDLTHEQLAADIGTAREVVSRGLASLARRGLIARTRSHIGILDRAGLQALASR
jgi:CRP/FNR family transcriptional regulator